ncbi:MAG: hypothetical protein HOD85_06290 [Deltaproteobacteria bacterium]|nr:hypothetical protein [Deltaproteobacteria bacterium]
MSTVRELTARLNFAVDTSQAEKFQRVIRDTNRSLQAVKTAKIVRDTGKVVKALKKMRTAFKKKLDTTKLGQDLNKLAKKTLNLKTKVKSLREAVKLMRQSLSKRLVSTKFGKGIVKVSESIKKLKEAFKQKIETTKLGKGLKAISDSMAKLSKATKSVMKSLKPGEMAKKVAAWLKGAAKAVTNNSKKFLAGVGGLAKKINLKGNLIRGALAGLAAITGGVIGAASKEDAEIRIQAFAGDDGLKKMEGNYKKIRSLSKGVFDDADIAKSASGFLAINNNFEAMNKLLPAATKLAMIHGKSLEEVMSSFAQFTVSGSEDSLKSLGVYDEREIELIRKQGKEASQFTNTQKLQTLNSQLAKKEGRTDAAFEKTLQSTSTKFKQVKGEITQTATEIGENWQGTVNKSMEKTKELLQWIGGNAKTVMSKENIEGAYAGANNAIKNGVRLATQPSIAQAGKPESVYNTTNTYNITATTSDNEKTVQKIASDIKATYYTNIALNPIKQGANQ